LELPEERKNMDEKMKKIIEEILWKLDTALEYYIMEMEAKEAKGQLNIKKQLSEEEIAENNEWRLLAEETVDFEGENDWEWRHKSA
jgi:hypothetical protein